MSILDTLRPDILGIDAAGAPVLLVEVRAASSPGEPDEAQLAGQLQEAHSVVPYVMLVDRSKIRVYRWEGSSLVGPVCEFPTVNILYNYDPEFGGKEVFGFYLERLVEGWLRDIAYQWKSATPPGYEALEAIGLAGRLRDGATVS